MSEELYEQFKLENIKEEELLTTEERELVFRAKYLEWYTREATVPIEKKRQHLLRLLNQYLVEGGIEKETGGGIDRKIEYITWEQYYEETMAVWSW